MSKPIWSKTLTTKDLLLLFAEWLKSNIASNMFDFNHVAREWDDVNECGTVCCAVGWLPKFQYMIPLDERDDELIVEWCKSDHLYGSWISLTEERDPNRTHSCYYEVAGYFFGMSLFDAKYLFSPNRQDYIKGWCDFPVCGNHATPTQVAEAIRHYVEIKGL